LSKKYLKAEMERLISSNDEELIINTLLDICFNFDEWEWVQDVCLKLMTFENENICGLAITCIGHIARIHSTIDKKKVLPVLKDKMNDERFLGRVEDALDDINMFT